MLESLSVEQWIMFGTIAGLIIAFVLWYAQNHHTGHTD